MQRIIHQKLFKKHQPLSRRIVAQKRSLTTNNYCIVPEKSHLKFKFIAKDSPQKKKKEIFSKKNFLKNSRFFWMLAPQENPLKSPSKKILLQIQDSSSKNLLKIH